jgi:hypothetical protein
MRSLMVALFKVLVALVAGEMVAAVNQQIY